MCWAYCCFGHSFEATSPFTVAPLPDAYEFRHTSLQIKSSICRMLAAARTAVDGRYLPSCCLQNTAAVDFLQTDCERHSALFHCYYSHIEALEACFRCLHVMWYDVIKCRYSQSSRQKRKLGCWIAPRCTINLSKIELARVFRTKGRYGSPRMMQDVGRRTQSGPSCIWCTTRKQTRNIRSAAVAIGRRISSYFLSILCLCMGVCVQTVKRRTTDDKKPASHCNRLTVSADMLHRVSHSVTLSLLSNPAQSSLSVLAFHTPGVPLDPDWHQFSLPQKLFINRRLFQYI